MVAAFFAGVAGGIYAHYIGVLDPSKFDFNYSVEILIMVVLGGMGSITGSVCSATVLTLLPEMLRSFADKRMLIYSLVLIIVMLFKPTGLLGTREFPCEKLWVSYSKKKRRIPARPRRAARLERSLKPWRRIERYWKPATSASPLAA